MGSSSTRGLVKGLGLLDSTTLVMGSMIGSGIFIVSADIARQTQSPGLLIMTWIVIPSMVHRAPTFSLAPMSNSSVDSPVVRAPSLSYVTLPAGRSADDAWRTLATVALIPPPRAEISWYVMPWRRCSNSASRLPAKTR